MLLSLISSPGRWDLHDPEQVRLLVRGEILAGVLTPDALRSAGRFGIAPGSAV